MRIKGKEHAIWENYEEVLKLMEEEIKAGTENQHIVKQEKRLKSDHIKHSEWMKVLIPSLNKITGDMLPLMQSIKGAKKKVQFDTYAETCADIEQIWDNYNHIFRSKAQLNALVHYLGTAILQYKLIVAPKIPISPLSQHLKSQEKVRNFYGKLEKIHDAIKISIDYLHVGIITEEELEKTLDNYIEWFENPDEKTVVTRFIDTLFSAEEVEKRRIRIAVRKHRANKKYSGNKITLEVVKNVDSVDSVDSNI